MTYGIDVLILIEVGKPRLRRQMFNIELNNESLAINIDFIIELRNKA